MFRLHGYARFLSDSDSHEALLQRLIALCVDDLLQLDLATYDLVLMPTAYPVHLAALAEHLKTLPLPRLRIGLLMPPAFWACDARAAQWLEASVQQSLDALRAMPGVALFGESGQYRAGSTVLALPTLLSPIADCTHDWIAAQVAQPSPENETIGRPLVFGFFGDPSPRKGFELLIHCVRGGLPTGARLVVALPERHEGLSVSLDGCGPSVTAHALEAGNAPYLKAMQAVDVVLAFYDPAVYGTQMSGIVSEAIALGKPVLVAEGCDAILRFLEMHAPGAFMRLPADAGGLHRGLAAPWSAWQGHRRAARAAAAGVRELKRMRRWLAPVA
ncbi:MAG: hypothetical protein EOO26_03295 [Comamonadaceae bacterium]|nr:MAG: hypothetical protein EOO26_03295 [Comamonadaceae bacterium]